MDEVLVTLRTEQGQSYELQVPAFVPIEELLHMLAKALELPVGPHTRIQAEPLGRILDQNRSLGEEGVAHGALLTLV